MEETSVLLHLGELLRAVAREVAAAIPALIEDDQSALRATLFVRRHGFSSYEGRVRYDGVTRQTHGFQERPPYFVVGEGIPGSCGMFNAVFCATLEESLLRELRGALYESNVRRIFGERFEISRNSLNSLSVDGMRSREAYISFPIGVDVDAVDRKPGVLSDPALAIVSIDTIRRGDFEPFYPETDAAQRKRDTIRRTVDRLFFRNRCMDKLTK